MRQLLMLLFVVSIAAGCGKKAQVADPAPTEASLTQPDAETLATTPCGNGANWDTLPPGSEVPVE